jgi:hypothetical protein
LRSVFSQDHKSIHAQASDRTLPSLSPIREYLLLKPCISFGFYTKASLTRPSKFVKQPMQDIADPMMRDAGDKRRTEAAARFCLVLPPPLYRLFHISKALGFSRRSILPSLCRLLLSLKLRATGLRGASSRLASFRSTRWLSLPVGRVTDVPRELTRVLSIRL